MGGFFNLIMLSMLFYFPVPQNLSCKKKKKPNTPEDKANSSESDTALILDTNFIDSGELVLATTRNLHQEQIHCCSSASL